MSAKTKKIIIWSVSVTAFLLALVLAFAIYVADCYQASDAAEAYVKKGEVQPNEISRGVYAFEPNETSVGFIFYPGGKVEHDAYYPLMQRCAEYGILSIVVEMPFNLAVLDVDAADGIKEKYPDIKSWYIGGHSLGGSMAASYAADNALDFEGVILLASYSTADLSQTELSVLSVYGSEDGVLNAEKYEKYLSNMPSVFEEHVIDGGCHAYFGMYGAQDGDGEPTISNEEQIDITVRQIAGFVF